MQQKGPCSREWQNVQDNDPASYAIWYGNSGSDQGPGEKDGGSRDEDVETLRFSLGKTRVDRIEKLSSEEE